MAQNDNLKTFRGGGIDTESAPEYVDINDAINRTNLRNTGTSGQELGYDTNIESNTLLAGALLSGINGVNGGAAFEEIAQGVIFRTNSTGKNQLLIYDYATNAYSVIYTDITDSAGQVLLPLDPGQWVNCILVNKTFLIWTAKNMEVGCTNLNTLKSGGYGTVLPEDMSLLKPQCMIPPTGVYGSDNGQPANYLYARLPQFIVQYVNTDFNYSAYSTRSKRIVPYQQNTPILGSNVGQNNYIIVSVNIGTIRATTINIGCQFDDSGIFSTIKSVDRSYVIALPNTSVSVATEVYEAYNPSTNLYSFAFYNNEVPIPIPATETDLAYDYIWPSNSCENINGNLVALGDFQTLYARPSTPVTIAAVGYNPNIAIPAGTFANPLTMSNKFTGSSGSGAGNHKRVMHFNLSGVPHTGDKIIVIDADIRNSQSVLNYTYIVPSGLDGNLSGVVAAFTPTLPSSSYVNNGGGSYTITWVDAPYYGGQTFGIELFFAGAAVANSIATALDNTTYQAALSYFDAKGRYLPLDTDNNFSITTPSYAQVLGNAIQFSWKINVTKAPAGAASYQWMLTKAPITKILDTMATPLNFKGTWNAKANTPTLAVNVGTVGDVWQITTPCEPIDTAHYTNLGHGETYNTGAYIVYNGQSWGTLPKEFGDLTSTGNILAFSLNPLAMFNAEYSTVGVNTVLVYDFAEGDRCTLHYYLDGSGNKIFINNPCVNLSVFGYNAGSYIVKVEKSAIFDASVLSGKNVFLRLYSPQKQNDGTSAAQNSIVYREIGERFTITNGNHDTLSGTFTDGGAYYKTRQFPDALLPYTNPPISVLATDLNYSDFYASAYSSFGRVRTYYDELEKTERKASIIPSQTYISGSRVNGLNRFYPANIYGDGDGQTSSSKGAIQVLWQRGNVLVAMQEHGVFYIPVNEAYQILNTQLTGIAISEKLFNNGRYETRNIGIGTAKASFCKRYDTGYFISPFDSQPMEITLGGVFPISGKMSKYFKGLIHAAYSVGKRLLQYYDTYYEELVTCIQSQSAIIKLLPFDNADWNPLDSYPMAGPFTNVNNGAHCTASYNSMTGDVTYTPATNYVGGDSAPFTFNPFGTPITKNNCLTWTVGSGNINSFSFNPQTGVNLSTVIQSNTVMMSGMDYPVAISITGGLYSVNGGAFTSSPGTVRSGDIVQVELTSSGSGSTLVTAGLTVSSPSATVIAYFNVTTKSNGNFGASAQYGFTITSIVNGTATGVPAGFATVSIPPNNNLFLVYTAITAGSISVTITGTPSIPGHVKLDLVVNGVQVSTLVVNMAGTYNLIFPSPVSDPTSILVAIDSF